MQLIYQSIKQEHLEEWQAQYQNAREEIGDLSFVLPYFVMGENIAACKETYGQYST